MSDGEPRLYGGVDTSSADLDTGRADVDTGISDSGVDVDASPEGALPVSLNGRRQTAPEDLPPLPPNRYLDREESWLRFNQRVLELAEDESVPLLERVRFLAIFATNLDEFFMVRVAGLMRRMAAGLPVEGVSMQLPGQVLNRTLDLAGG